MQKLFCDAETATNKAYCQNPGKWMCYILGIRTGRWEKACLCTRHHNEGRKAGWARPLITTDQDAFRCVIDKTTTEENYREYLSR